MNLLSEPVLSISGGDRVSLPGLFASMAQGKVRGFPRLRPHQRPALHMFLVQLGALALWGEQQDARTALPQDAASWTAVLRRLSSDYPNDAPWCLIPERDADPAFLQPPVPGSDTERKWVPVATPDALDMLITSRNHDLKQTVAREAAAEDWVLALVSLQTTEGFGGQKNYGIARMNGGSSSRPMMGLAPARGKEIAIDPAAWWARDVRQLLAFRAAGQGGTVGTPGGPMLLWCCDWPEGKQLDPRELDPWFIEVCRRVRLQRTDGVLSARRSTSTAPRVAARPYRGNLGDPWAPVHRTEGKSFTLGSGDFDYRRLCSLLFSGDWEVPPLALQDAHQEAGDMLLVAEALARGNAKTEGFKSRVLPVPGRVVGMLSTPTATSLSQEQMKEIESFDAALRFALAIVAARGDRERLNKAHYASTRPARTRFNRVVDRLFFPSLWHRLAAVASPDAGEAAKIEFLADLHEAAQVEFEAALPAIPCPVIHQLRAETRARRVFRNMIRKAHPELFEREDTSAVI